ncbi:MAG TPA: ABC transporter ATP-binding protein [Candidatus Dormibacteraeota bacterium]|nr:ABC transporter ATP-binding protein [Candidatus Dormibacteraeota bacterium]
MDAVTPALRVRDVFRIFRSGPVETVALRGANLEVEAGEFVALVGPSGCGKSTLLHIAAALDEPNAGSVEVAGQSLAGLDEQRLVELRRHRIGVVFQRDNLWGHLTALQNVALVGRLGRRKDADTRAHRLLDELGLGNREAHRPAALSGGEQQRVAVAAALVNDPALLLADEPTGELDRANEGKVLDMLDEARRRHGCGLLVVTHSDDVARRAGRVVRMENGTCS